MVIGNKPKQYTDLVVGKWYCWISTYRAYNRMQADGWHTFEFVITRLNSIPERGEAFPSKIRIAFSFWFPIDRA